MRLSAQYGFLPKICALRHSKRLYVRETGPVDDMAMLLLCGDCDFRVSLLGIEKPTDGTIDHDLYTIVNLRFRCHRPQDQIQDSPQIKYSP